MRIPFQERNRRDPEPPEHFGEQLAGVTLGTNKICWDVAGDLRKLYYTTIHPGLRDQLLAVFGTASFSDWITLPVYMVGHNRTDAVPTVMVCSEDKTARKKANKELRKNPVLKECKFNVISVPTDPGIQGELEQLASGTGGVNQQTVSQRATRVLIDTTKPLDRMGMEIWVAHGSSLRPATAFATKVQGRTLLRTVDHAFFAAAPPSRSTNITHKKLPIHVDSDSEDDSEFDDEEEFNVAITSIGSQSPDAWFDGGSSDGGSSDASVILSGRSTPLTYGRHTSTDFDIQEISSRLEPFSLLPNFYLPRQIDQPPKENLVGLGTLAFSSVDKDWALIEITNKDVASELEQFMTIHPLPARPLPGPKEDAQVVASTASSGTLTGSLIGVPFSTRVPNSSSFQDVYRVCLNGALANGDCGSPVQDASTGELYGHIIAGCRSTGTAYIMAAHLVEADFDGIHIGQETESLCSQRVESDPAQAQQPQPSVSNGPNQERCDPPQRRENLEECQKMMHEEIDSPTTPIQYSSFNSPREKILRAARGDTGSGSARRSGGSDGSIFGKNGVAPTRSPIGALLESGRLLGTSVVCAFLGLFWAGSMFSILSLPLYLVPQLTMNDAVIVPPYSNGVFYGLILLAIAFALFSRKIRAFLDTTLAVVKLTILVAVCILGCFTQLSGNSKGTQSDRLYDQERKDLRFENQRVNSPTMEHLPLARDPPVSIIMMSSISDFILFWSSGHSVQMFYGLALGIIVILGILLASRILYFSLKSRQNKNLKRLPNRYLSSSIPQDALNHQRRVMLRNSEVSLFSQSRISLGSILLVISVGLARYQSEVIRGFLMYEGSLWMLNASGLVLLMIPGIG